MDNFGRPRQRGIYRPLAPQFIRVLELDPGGFADNIVGRLVPQAIDGESYEAVSYVWGDTRNRRDITINGTTLSVTANLHGALTAFRYRPGSARYRRGVRRLWADAVCINQEDLSERTSQVELMARIFANARRVLAWLGWEEGEEDHRHHLVAVRFIHSFMEDPEANLREARILFLHKDELSGDDRRKFEKQARTWEAVKQFFEIQYFHRTWIVQELGLAREAIMFTALKPTVGADQALELVYIDWPLVGRFVRFLDYSGASLVTHLGLRSWVAHHILMVWETKEDGTPECDFLTGMHWARILGVTDARDRVHGLLGHPLAVMEGELVVKPDYTATRGVVYTRLAANFIRKTKNLYVLSLVDHEDDPSTEAKRDWDPQDDGRMPTWVPDWHSINRTTPFDYSPPAAEVEDPDIRIDGETQICAKGTPLPHLLLWGWVVDEISAVSRRMETTDFPVTHLARERAKQNPFWLDRVWELVFPAIEGSTDARDALAVLESLSLALPLGTQEVDQPVRRAIGPQQTLEEHRRSFAAYVLEYHELWRCASEARGTGTARDDCYVPTRSLYGSLPVEAQAELLRRAEGATSGGFIECMTWLSMCRVVYRTKSGLVGMGSRVSRPGDIVCRVRGSSVLMTLRRIKDPGASRDQVSETGATPDAAPILCVYIGPTVVPARMKRDVVDGGEFGEMAATFRVV
ncbi:hypothetical protein N657DRAFT_639741 [Parathielavia appendiculata]|uniref:Heterokaryon incompatibility domain-containing protein n=1 Tax=Parathielavia appendiculata TaxID=2587402 RepID=A0AAN6UAR3_9PEZI|nr:hypothetical protein N657DRAFT_639741 [Parathielavia appendiculata]